MLEVRTSIFIRVIMENKIFKNSKENLIEFFVKKIETKSFPPEDILI
jgi:hypothetical protein